MQDPRARTFAARVRLRRATSGPAFGSVRRGADEIPRGRGIEIGSIRSDRRDNRFVECIRRRARVPEAGEGAILLKGKYVVSGAPVFIEHDDLCKRLRASCIAPAIWWHRRWRRRWHCKCSNTASVGDARLGITHACCELVFAGEPGPPVKPVGGWCIECAFAYDFVEKGVKEGVHCPRHR